MNSYIAVVDIGTSEVTVVVGQRSENGGLDVAGYATETSLGVKRGVVLNIGEVVKVLGKAIKKATHGLNIEICKVLVGVSGQQVRMIPNHGHCWVDLNGEVTREDVNKLLEDAKKVSLNRGEKIFHVIPQSFVVDQEEGIINPVGIAGNKLEGRFCLLVAQESYFRNIERCFQKLNIEVKGATITPLATAEAVLSEEEKEAGVVLVDFGAGTTSVAVFYEGIVRQVGVIPFGGNVITQDIKEGCAILPRQAEKLKVQYGNAFGENASENKVISIPGIQGWEPKEISFKSLAFIIQARVEELIESIWFYVQKSGLSERLGAGIVITGGGSKLNGIDDLIRIQTGMDVRIGGSLLPVNGQYAEDLACPEFSAVLGLLKSAIAKYQGNEIFVENKPNNDKTMPEQQTEKRSSSGKGKSGFQKLTKFVGELFTDDDMTMN